MAVKVYKLISGEDIISSVVEETRDTVVLKSPASIIMQQAGEGRVGAGLAAFSPFAKDGRVVLYRIAIAVETEVDVKLENEYNRIFGSGIVIAAAGDVPKIVMQ